VKVEVLYMPDCPHFPSAVKQLRDVLLAEGVRTEIKEVVVTDAKAAEECGFRGSPTIRINGQDIAGESHTPQSFVLACRIYPGTLEAGVPPLKMMQRAVREARKGGEK
jgi:glutaredoxin